MLRFLIYLLPLSILSQTPSNFEIGQKPSDKILNIEMINIDDKLYSLNNLSSNNGLLIIFSSNTCPFVLMWQDRYKIIERLCKENELGLVYINSNSKNQCEIVLCKSGVFRHARTLAIRHITRKLVVTDH